MSMRPYKRHLLAYLIMETVILIAAMAVVVLLYLGFGALGIRGLTLGGVIVIGYALFAFSVEWAKRKLS